MFAKQFWTTFSVSCVLVFTLSGSVAANEKGVTIYGGPRCTVSKGIMQDLDSMQIPYKYVDISTKSGNEEMYQQIFENNMLNLTVQTPVVDVNGHFVGGENFITTQEVLAKLDLPPASFEDYNRNLVAEIYSEQGDEITQRLITALEKRSLPYEFHNLRDRETNLEWQKRLKEKGMRPRSIPATFINGEVFVGLDSAEVLNAYQ